MLTFAAFTDEGSVTADFATGDVDITFDRSEDGSPEAYVSKLKLENAQIGDVTYATLLVNNSGSLPFSYTAMPRLNDDSDAGLAAALTIDAVRVTNTAGCVASAFAATTSSPLTDVSELTLDRSAVLNSVGEDLPNSDLFCFEVTLPGSTTGDTAADNANDNTLQNKKAGITIDFLATQLTS